MLKVELTKGKPENTYMVDIIESTPVMACAAGNEEALCSLYDFIRYQNCL